MTEENQYYGSEPQSRENSSFRDTLKKGLQEAFKRIREERPLTEEEKAENSLYKTLSDLYGIKVKNRSYKKLVVAANYHIAIFENLKTREGPPLEKISALYEERRKDLDDLLAHGKLNRASNVCGLLGMLLKLYRHLETSSQDPGSYYAPDSESLNLGKEFRFLKQQRIGIQNRMESPVYDLRLRLREAVKSERYEAAAALRDKLEAEIKSRNSVDDLLED